MKTLTFCFVILVFTAVVRADQCSDVLKDGVFERLTEASYSEKVLTKVSSFCRYKTDSFQGSGSYAGADASSTGTKVRNACDYFFSHDQLTEAHYKELYTASQILVGAWERCIAGSDSLRVSLIRQEKTHFSLAIGRPYVTTKAGFFISNTSSCKCREINGFECKMNSANQDRFGFSISLRNGVTGQVDCKTKDIFKPIFATSTNLDGGQVSEATLLGRSKSLVLKSGLQQRTSSCSGTGQNGRGEINFALKIYGAPSDPMVVEIYDSTKDVITTSRSLDLWENCSESDSKCVVIKDKWGGWGIMGQAGVEGALYVNPPNQAPLKLVQVNPPNSSCTHFVAFTNYVFTTEKISD